VLHPTTVAAIALIYIGCLFAVASYGDRAKLRRNSPHVRALVYALTLAIYCTSWTFFGSVGLASISGFDFLAIYVGPVLLIGLGWPAMRRIVRLSKAQNITSIADFIAARYGKSLRLAAVVTVIAVIGIVPYIALQLKAVADSVNILIGAGAAAIPFSPDLALIVATSMAIFAILFGTRHIDATEHQEGLMLAVAAESVVKLFAFLVVGGFVTFWMAGGVSGIADILSARPDIADLFGWPHDGARWVTMMLIATGAIVLLPRQFHVAVVENVEPDDTRRAAWLFPIYLVLINLFVVPVAISGKALLAGSGVAPDMYVLALPVEAGNGWVTLIAFIGGLSAATAMVIVASVALSIMVCNDLVVPMLLRRKVGLAEHADMGGRLITIRRVAIFAIVLLAFAYYRLVGNAFALASIGLISFVAVAQFAPAFFGGLVWRHATEKGALAGIVTGIVLWGYTLLLPSIAQSGWLDPSLVEAGPFAISLLRPQALLGLDLDPLTHGALWSLAANLAAFVVVSALTERAPVERLQADLFTSGDFQLAVPRLRLSRTSVSVCELKATAARYLGTERTERAFSEYAAQRGITLDDRAGAEFRLLRFTEQLMARAVGAASSRLVMALALGRNDLDTRAALKLLDEASEAIRHSRDLLQSAIDHLGQGISVFDEDMHLVCWNRRYCDLLDLDPQLVSIGVPLPDILRTMARRGGFGPGNVEEHVAQRIDRLVVSMTTHHERLEPSGRILEVRTNALPGGGIVTTYSDITERENAALELARANETLERRVLQRTAELTRLNRELIAAKAAAEEANLGKTRFIAAASHDILQPLNAARLYTTSLVERRSTGEAQRLARNIDASLEAVEDILGALLDISRIDAGALQPEFATVDLDELLAHLKVESEPLARERGLDLTVIPARLAVRSDRRLLHRILQNLISNAIKYTVSGRVLVGCRRTANEVRIEVHDTGPGISPQQQKMIFNEFQRLESGASGVRGLGLGLSIVERIAALLGHGLDVRSLPGKGSAFSVSAAREAVSTIAPRLERPSRKSSVLLSGMVVMVIDNEPDILSGMTALLKGWGCLVWTCESGEEALDIVRNAARGPDIILADYHLDSGDGLAAIAALRAHAGQPFPAILLTTDRSPAVKLAAVDTGIELIGKPVKPASLRALMAQAGAQRMAAE
jgi:Na+/proline symporter/signal transduction histidine kinase/ActR/RegA family two-component response regulator